MSSQIYLALGEDGITFGTNPGSPEDVAPSGGTWMNQIGNSSAVPQDWGAYSSAVQGSGNDPTIGNAGMDVAPPLAKKSTGMMLLVVAVGAAWYLWGR